MSNNDDLQLRCKVWLERDGHVAVSDWRVELLEHIDRCGSLAEAARKMNVPYKTAWYKLKEMQSAMGVDLVVTQSGGPSGGGARLTANGLEVVRAFHRLVGGVDELLTRRFAQAFPGSTGAPKQRGA